jgi:GDSL-like Lipase/Acylhydrolase family
VPRSLLLTILAASSLAGALTAAPAVASPGAGAPTAVSMGDSYISGEAGRWAGNSIDPAPGNDGTDRACLPAGSPACQVDQSKVYVGGSTDGCHRSDTAEILSAKFATLQPVNIACSGAVTQNLLLSRDGGVGQNGEPAQGDSLLYIARARNVKLIAVSIGGNDYGFATIVQDCLEAYVAQTGPCQPKEQPKLDAAQAGVISKIGNVVKEIHGIMTEAGYAKTDYRLVFQTYPSVAPRSSELRYPGAERTVNGCPFYNSDADWARDKVVVQIGASVKFAALTQGAEVLDLQNAFQGHEFCSKSDRQATATDRPAPAQSEWGRFVGASSLSQGMTQELFHPNAYGQMALGACLSGVATAAQRGQFACTGSAGIAPSAVKLTHTG